MATATDPLAANGQSPLRGALLALLVQGPSHGYELANRLERQLGSEWRIARPSLYRMLKGMRVEGLLSADTPEVAESKIVYRATGGAETALILWMESALSLDDGQLQLQARMIVARQEDLPRLLIAVNSYERRLVGLHSELRAVTVEAGSLLSAMMRLVRGASRHRIEAELLWLDEARHTIHALLALQESQR
jgi:DNA-binding PadR family transcriptional regulator